MSDSAPTLEPTPSQLAEMTRAVADFVVEQVATLAEQPSFDLDGAEAVRAGFREQAPELGRPIEQILERLGPALAKSYNAAGPGYLAYIPGGGVYAAALGALIASATNRYVGVTAPAPALAQIEQSVTEWLCALMGLPEGAQGLLTSGGSLSNFSAIVAARQDRLGDDLARGTIYCSTETHYCVAKAARLAGFPRAALRALPVDERFRLRPDALAAALREDRARGLRPFLLVANVGTTNTGAIDPLPELRRIADENGLWLHADAAYGGFFRLAPGGEELLRGVETATRSRSTRTRACSCRTASARCSCATARRSRVPTAAPPTTCRTWRTRARSASPTSRPSCLATSAACACGCRCSCTASPRSAGSSPRSSPSRARRTSSSRPIRASSSSTSRSSPWSRSACGRRTADADRLSAELLRRVNERRRVFLSSTRLRGRYALRICVLSFRTHEDRVQDAVTALREEAKALLG